MEHPELFGKSIVYLDKLCREIPERCVGSEGNRAATTYFEKVVASHGWETEAPGFSAIDWRDGGATLVAGNREFAVLVSPYANGCSVTAPLSAAGSLEQLEKGNFRDTVLLLHGDIAKEQLMPKNFVFYNPEEHRQIIAALEASGVKAIISATGRNAELAGGVYPFPLCEDGDFDIPSVYMTEEEGRMLLPHAGEMVTLKSDSERIPGTGCNVIGRIGVKGADRIVVTAHIDAKKGTPGAIDNGTGVAVLMLLAELLADYAGPRQIELVAFNGEDYYAVPGQMQFVAANSESFHRILLNINIDGAGYREGPSAFSFYDLPGEILMKAMSTLEKFSGITEGVQWPQGDHSIFIQFGRPAIAVSSKWFTDNINDQDITHTPKDNLSVVDYHRVVEISLAIKDLIIRL